MDWTPSRINIFIRNVLRAGAKRWPPKFEAMADAFTGSKISKSGRMAKHYRCAACQEEFTSKDINMDHIEPAVDPLVGFVDWNTYVDRLFIPKEGYQVLCIDCHLKKSAQEKAKAKEKKRESR